MKNNQLIFFLSLIVISLACTKKGTPSASGSKYEEDLEQYRPKYEIKETAKPAHTTTKPAVSVVIKEHNNVEVEEKLNQIREKNKGIKYTQGYKIQIYSGNSQEAAEKAKEGIYRLNLNLEPEIIYFPPNFKVKVGDYYDRIEAYETLLKIRESFPQALLLPERVTIK